MSISAQTNPAVQAPPSARRFLGSSRNTPARNPSQQHEHTSTIEASTTSGPAFSFPPPPTASTPTPAPQFKRTPRFNLSRPPVSPALPASSSTLAVTASLPSQQPTTTSRVYQLKKHTNGQDDDDHAADTIDELLSSASTPVPLSPRSPPPSSPPAVRHDASLPSPDTQRSLKSHPHASLEEWSTPATPTAHTSKRRRLLPTSTTSPPQPLPPSFLLRQQSPPPLPPPPRQRFLLDQASATAVVSAAAATSPPAQTTAGDAIPDTPLSPASIAMLFSPHRRRGARFQPSGLADVVRAWVVQTAAPGPGTAPAPAAASATATEAGGARSVQIERVRGGDGVLVAVGGREAGGSADETLPGGGEDVKVLLLGGGRRAAEEVQRGKVVQLWPPIWDVGLPRELSEGKRGHDRKEAEMEPWTVGVMWKVL